MSCNLATWTSSHFINKAAHYFARVWKELEARDSHRKTQNFKKRWRHDYKHVCAISAMLASAAAADPQQHKTLPLSLCDEVATGCRNIPTVKYIMWHI
jgi:hypothetical protein